jgi:hypothetical protein
MEMVFAEKFGWRDIDDMPLSERRRKLEIIEALAEAEASRASNAASRAGTPRTQPT